MIKTFIAAVLMTVSVCADAQEKSSGFLEFQTGIPVPNGNPSLEIRGGFLKRVDSNVKLGAGLGVIENSSFNATPQIPVFGRAEFLFTNTGNVRPYISFDLGSNINVEHIDYSLLFINPMIGAYFNRFNMGVGYVGANSFCEGSAWMSMIGVRLGYVFGKTKTMDWKNTALYRFMKHTTFCLEASYGIGLCTDYSGLSLKCIGCNWVYALDDHWATGIGVDFGQFNYDDSYFGYSDDVNWDLYLRCEYTGSEIATQLKPYGCIDFGNCGLGDGVYIAPQIGVKYKKHYRFGISAANRSGFYGGGDALALHAHLGVDF